MSCTLFQIKYSASKSINPHSINFHLSTHENRILFNIFIPSRIIQHKCSINGYWLECLHLQFYLTFMYHFTFYKALTVSHIISLAFTINEAGKTSINGRGVGSHCITFLFKKKKKTSIVMKRQIHHANFIMNDSIFIAPVITHVPYSCCSFKNAFCFIRSSRDSQPRHYWHLRLDNPL